VLAEDRKPDRQLVTPLLCITGSDSAATKREFVRVDSTDEFAHVWALHLGNPHPIKASRLTRVDVDFGRCTLVAVFNGEALDAFQLRVRECVEDKDAVTVVYWCPERGVSDEHVLTKTHAYCFVALPKTKKQIILEEEEIDDKGKKTRVRRAALPAKSIQ
jgi:hypothetical protein